LNDIKIQFNTQDRRTGARQTLPELLALTQKDSGKSEEDVFCMANIKDMGFYLGKKKPEDITSNYLDHPINELVAYNMTAAVSIYDKDYSKAFTAQTQAVTCFLKIFADLKEQNWTLSILYQMLLDLRRMARIADRAQMALFKHKPDKNCPIGERSMLEIAADLYMQAFRTCVADNRADIGSTKRWGILFITNQLFKIYFMINKLHLLKPLLRAVDQCDLKDRFPLSQRVTYKFFQGRKALFENDYVSATDCLEFAFTHCHKGSTQNKRQILLYLIPVKLIKGSLPTLEFLQEHLLDGMFGGIVNSMKSGDLELFDKTLEDNMQELVRNRILLAVEKLRVVVQRTLFKKIHAIIGSEMEATARANGEDAEKAKNKSNLLPLKALHDALADYENTVRENDDLLDKTETECIVSALIANGYMKGYIAHAHEKVVMSRKNPFPIISTIQ